MTGMAENRSQISVEKNRFGKNGSDQISDSMLSNRIENSFDLMIVPSNGGNGRKIRNF